MIIIKCDFCGVVISTSCHPKATITRGAIVREYELCSSCAGKLIDDLEKKVKV